MDLSVAPGDDFFSYANGTWVKQTEMPGDQGRWGNFDILIQKSLGRVRELLDGAASSGASPGSEERKVGDFYATYLDEAAANAKGIEPIRPLIAAIEKLKDKSAFARAAGEDLRADVDPLNNTNYYTSRLFGFWVAGNLTDPSVNTAYLFQGGLGMPDREYYLSDNPKMAATREKYRGHIARMFALAGFKDGEARARRIFDLETRMARVHATRAESLEVKRANNPWKRTDFARRAPGLDWNAFFRGAGLEDQPLVIVWHPQAISALAALVKQVPLSTWKEWMTFHLLDRSAAQLSQPLVEESFDFNGRTINGAPEIAPRWKRAAFATGTLLGDAVGKLYVAKYFPASAKAQVREMADNISAAFDRRLQTLEWMTPETRAQAREKVKTLYIGVGYPETWKSYEGLEVVRGDLLGNVRRASLFEYQRRRGLLGKPVDMHEWWMEPQTVNAVNLPLQNALNFPAAILEPPFFDPTATAACNYGSIGGTIGHEVSHSFDDQGALFDAQGKLRDWWTKADFAHFEQSGVQLAAQYDAYQPFPDMHVNGKQTLSETIADLAGLGAAHDAWTRSLGGNQPPVVDGLTGEQQFFICYAQSWRVKFREPFLRFLIVADGHPPDMYRAQTVRNLDPWYQAFGVKPGQKLYLSPEQRVRVW